MEKLFAVSFIAFHDNELYTAFIKAENDVDAIARCGPIRELLAASREEIRAAKNQEKLKEAAFDCDCMINSVEVPQ